MKEQTPDQVRLEYENDRQKAIDGANIVYYGGIIVTTALFISFILTAFPEDAYLIRMIMSIGGIMVGYSAIAFKIALQKWALSGEFQKTTTWLYRGELLIIAINTFVSFSVMLAKYAEWTIPAWVALIEPFTIVAIVYTIVAWGHVFSKDPYAKSKQKLVATYQKVDETIIEQFEQYVDTDEGKEAIRVEADHLIAERFNVMRHAPKKWTKANDKQPTRIISSVVEQENPTLRER